MLIGLACFTPKGRDEVGLFKCRLRIEQLQTARKSATMI